MKKPLMLLTAIALFSGCTTIINSVRPREQKNTFKGYLYGQFYQQNSVQTRISLILINLDTEETDSINLGARGIMGDPEKYGVSSVIPGKYQIINIEISIFEKRGSETYSFHDKKPFNDPVFSQPFEVKAGEKVYLGDFIAKTAHSGTNLIWSLKPESTFEETTKAVNEVYTNIAELPTREAFEIKK